MTNRVNVLGVGISPLNIPLALAAMGEAIDHRRKGYICVTGVNGVSEAQSNPALRSILNHAFINTPDGMPLVWLGRLAGHREIDRVDGPDLLLQACRVSRQTGWRHFFYGGGPGAAEQLERALRQLHPHLDVVGTFTPPFRPLNDEEKKALQEQVVRTRPDIIWVGLSTPKQEAFMAEALGWLDATLLVGVGAAFDLLSGRVRQAPHWMQRNRLEWLFHLAQEPRRVATRYLKNNPVFVARIAAQQLGLRRYTLDRPA